MIGMNATTGAKLTGIEHLMQSINVILTTPIGFRVMRRDFGSRLFSLIDAPANRSTVMSLYAAIADALNKWEKRLTLQRVQLKGDYQGKFLLDLIVTYNGRLFQLPFTANKKGAFQLENGEPLQLDQLETG